MQLLSLSGGFISLFLFLLCFALALLCRYARLGYRLSRKQKEEPQESDRKAEPVYYIVERKKKAPKKDFSEPKEIQFK